MAGYTVICGVTSPSRREKIHTQIKSFSRYWWHHLDDVWIVHTDLSITEIRDSIKPNIIDGELLVVLALKETPGGRWSTKNAKTSWFRKAFSTGNEN